ncbi:HNH endonuclease [Flavobacterium sp. LB2P84]|uniref:HNH endonuclease n=1 Tax=Flavobacterium yafengii TaxID=3041253 RepID=A0AAW6TQW5_9FLAO|nr:HNH endonuclease [Flavobacterium yafengii]MDI5950205.1 HNH endonuclease [Flavobacterium yafengii]MDI6034707.1 HNH endonuclease [Flavobacterium yafengii]
MTNSINQKKCIWCLKSTSEVTFIKKAHTIPKSLGGQNFNRNVCDDCNYYFGNRDSHNGKYSIEVALKEAFSISRKRFLLGGIPKRKVGEFKSQFFEMKERKGKFRLGVKPSFMFASQLELCRAFKRGLYKMYFEELNRQKKVGFESSYDIIRSFSRYNLGDLPVLYFTRKIGVMIFFKSEAETPILYFSRMNYLYLDSQFAEIEFLGHVFGFPIAPFTKEEFENYASKSIEMKKDFFIEANIISKFTDIDISLNIMNN